MVVVKRAFAAGSAVVLVACTALLGIDKDYQPASLPEGGGMDAGMDTATGMDAPDDVPLAEGASPCSVQHAFCDDFDTNALGIGWTGTFVGAKAAMMIDTLGYVSAPKSLYSATAPPDAAPNGPDTDARIVRMVLGKYKTAVVEMDVRVELSGKDPAMTVEIAGLAFVAQSGNPNWHMLLHHYATKLQLVEAHFGYPDGGFDWYYNDLPQVLTVGKWAHLRMEATTGGAKTHGKVIIDGQTIFDQDLLEYWSVDCKTELQIGTYAMWWGQDQWKVRFDNVTIDAQ